MMCVINVLALFAEDYLDTYGRTKDSGQQFVVSEFVINFCYTAEMIIQIVVWGPSFCWKYKLHMKLELGYQIVNLGLFIWFLTGRGDVDDLTRFLSLIILLRILKLSNLLSEIWQWRLIMDTTRALFTPFWVVMLSTFILFYIFAQIGERAFGGLVQNNDLQILTTTDFPDTYTLMNMNDMVASFITLFAVMVVNNWQVLVAVFTTVSGTNWSWWYFIIFYFFSVIVITNIVISFVIDMYGNVSDLQDEKDKMREEEE